MEGLKSREDETYAGFEEVSAGVAGASDAARAGSAEGGSGAVGEPGGDPDRATRRGDPDTLRGWVKQAQIDAGERPGTTTNDASRIKQLEAEVRELKRANEILLAASSFFAREPDPRLPW